MEAIRSSETSVNKISTWRHIPEDDVLHSHRRENLKSYIAVDTMLNQLKLALSLECPALIHESTVVHFYLAEPRRRAVTVIP
jgi:hypothetical protein